MTINRTGYATALRVTLSTDTATGTVPSDPSVSRDAEGAGTLPTPDAFSRYARVTENVHYDSEVTAVPQRTCTPSSSDTGTPMLRSEVA